MGDRGAWLPAPRHEAWTDVLLRPSRLRGISTHTSGGAFDHLNPSVSNSPENMDTMFSDDSVYNFLALRSSLACDLAVAGELGKVDVTP